MRAETINAYTLAVEKSRPTLQMHLPTYDQGAFSYALFVSRVRTTRLRHDLLSIRTKLLLFRSGSFEVYLFCRHRA
jgi:hypothetical protein